MTEELIVKGQELSRELAKNKHWLNCWCRATNYYGGLSINYNQGSFTSPNIIPFEEYKARAIYYFQKKVDELQTEFDNL